MKIAANRTAFLVLLLCLIPLARAIPCDVTTYEQKSGSLELRLSTGELVRVDAITADMVRVRIAPQGAFGRSLPIELGFVKDDWPTVPLSVEASGSSLVARTERMMIKVARHPFGLEFHDRETGLLTQLLPSPSRPAPAAAVPAAGSTLMFAMQPEEHFFGFGFQRVGLDARGRQLHWERRFRHGEATVPFFMSTAGYAIYSNNPWDQRFDFTATQTKDDTPAHYEIQMTGGQADFYVLRGPGFRALLDRYTQLTGRPQLAPRWTMGQHYICRYYETQSEVLRIAAEFRRRDIPWDMIGLEPGWEAKSYSMDWRWSPERFPDPREMIQRLGQEGFRFALWESGAAPTKDFTSPHLRRDWYRKRVAASVDLGVKFFKQDDPYPRMIRSTELEDGVLAEDQIGDDMGEAKNAANSLYCETAVKEYERLTGERAFFIFNSYFASIGSHRWPTAWAGDFAAADGLLNAGLSGHAMVSLDMDAATLAGIHFGYLTPFAIVDAWAYYKEPWLYPKYLEQAHQFYAKLRHRLAPYLYSTLHQAHRTGMPMMRAMVLDHPHDPATWNLNTQHMLGDYLLVGSQAQVYLPAGRWFNYWTGESYDSLGQLRDCAFDEPAGGPLLVRAGAIIPMEPVTPWLGQEAAELIMLDVFPDTTPSEFTLFEDDGHSLKYRGGEVATTHITCVREGRTVRLGIGARTGTYAGQPPARTYLISLHVGVAPTELRLDGTVLARLETRAALTQRAGVAGWAYEGETGIVWVKPAAGWQLGPDVRGAAADPEQDTLAWSTTDRPTGRPLALTLSLPANAPTVFAARQVPAKGAGLYPDRLIVVANPPERILLKHGKWLKMLSTFYVTACAGDSMVPTAQPVIQMEVLNAQGQVIQTEKRTADRGRAVFSRIPYVPEEYLFRFTSLGLKGCETRIRKVPDLVGEY